MTNKTQTEGKTSTVQSDGVTETPKIRNETDDYNEYVFAWGNQIQTLQTLCFVRDAQLSAEVQEAIGNLYRLMVKVAKVKFHKEVA